MARFHLIQVDSVWEDSAATCAQLDRNFESEKPEAGSLVVMPELFDVGFTMNSARAVEHAETTKAWLATVAKRFSVHVIAGVARRGANGVENRAVFVDTNGNENGSFSKLHGFSLAGENKNYRAGEKPVVWEWNVDGRIVKIAPLICYDLRFPEVFRAALNLGAEAFIVIANWPSTRSEHWNALLKARAIENQALVVAVNRIGSDPTLSYVGESQLINPWGEVICKAGAYQTTLITTFDLSEVATARDRYPFVKDRRL
ncbi:MAG TPA: nitrilase-related carbon-nitrogen hydrolase [Tepidisphaeraceae bacterium]|nr:nitrilase-related carbon-nitrogen hydrolase [Tepidisphaeraceae bacterium]